MTIPKYIPNAASSLANVIEPSSGEQVTGFVAGDPADAEAVNFYLNALGSSLEAVADAPSFQWRPMTSFSSANFQDGTLQPNGNANGVHDPKLFTASLNGYIYAQGYKNGTNHYTTIRTKLGQGYQALSVATDDQYAGNQIASEFESTMTADSNEVPGTWGRVITHATNLTSDLIRVAYLGAPTNAIKYQYSTDNGFTWTGASGGFTTVASGVMSSELQCVFAFRGAWYVGVKSGAGPYSTQFYKSSSLNLATSTWALSFACSNAATVADFVGRRVVRSSTMAVVLPEADNCLTAWDGTTRTNVAFGASDGSRTAWRGAYNQNTGLFLIANLQGDAWTSMDGLTWGSIGSLGACYDIAAHGRGFLYVGGSGGSVVSFVSQDHTQQWTVQESLDPYGSTLYNPIHLVATKGAVIAVRTGNDGTVWRTEWYRSDVHPLDRGLT